MSTHKTEKCLHTAHKAEKCLTIENVYIRAQVRKMSNYFKCLHTALKAEKCLTIENVYIRAQCRKMSNDRKCLHTEHKAEKCLSIENVYIRAQCRKMPKIFGTSFAKCMKWNVAVNLLHKYCCNFLWYVQQDANIEF
jgi:hypothetical protein